MHMALQYFSLENRHGAWPIELAAKSFVSFKYIGSHLSYVNLNRLRRESEIPVRNLQQHRVLFYTLRVTLRGHTTHATSTCISRLELGTPRPIHQNQRHQNFRVLACQKQRRVRSRTPMVYWWRLHTHMAFDQDVVLTNFAGEAKHSHWPIPSRRNRLVAGDFDISTISRQILDSRGRQ
jgi:hypothetical protein